MYTFKLKTRILKAGLSTQQDLLFIYLFLKRLSKSTMTNNCFFRVNHNFHRSSEKHCKKDPFQKATAANVTFKYRLDLFASC